jgi:glycosyltransferase involved in cell wall biosynthesis
VTYRMQNKLRIIVNCGPSEEFISRCLTSVREQSFEGWEAYVTVDPCGDQTFEEALAARQGDRRIHVHQNTTRLYSMVNTINAIGGSNAHPEDVFVVLDGDDWFATPEALRIIHDTYLETDCWMTYGSWISSLASGEGRWPAYPEALTDFRGHPWLGTAMRTWKRWLWDLIDDRDFRDAKGAYFRVTEDQAVILPMLEMSGTARARHIAEVLMVYNRSSPHACVYTCREEMFANTDYIRSLPPYTRLTEKPKLERHGLNIAANGHASPRSREDGLHPVERSNSTPYSRS